MVMTIRWKMPVETSSQPQRRLYRAERIPTREKQSKHQS